MPYRLAIRVAAAVLFGAAYVLGCHWLMTRAAPSPWNVVGVVAPMAVAIAVGAWRGGQRWLGAAAGLGIAALCLQALLGLAVPTRWLYLAQHVGINLCLGLGFASTLRTGRVPLITALAERVHGGITPAMAAYTRRCTLAWVLYFGAVSLLSIGLYGLAPFEAWALFANLLSPLSVAAMFGGEYLLRYRLHPEFERASLADAVRSYRHRNAAAAAPAGVRHDGSA